MTISNDPILQLRELRSEVAAPRSQAQLRAREAMFAKRSRPPLRPIVAMAVCTLTLVIVVAALMPWTRPQSAEAAVDALARTASEQKTFVLGPGDWITTRYTTNRSWTQDLTQEKLDRLSARAVAVSVAANGSGHLMRTGGGTLTAAELAKVDRLNERRLDRLRAGVKLDELPTTQITAWNTSSYASARNARGGGSGGGGNNVVEYESPEQKQAAAILQRAGIGGRAADPTDFGGFEIAELPNSAVSDQADVEMLATAPEKLRTQLAGWKQSGLPRAEAPKGSPLDIFVKATGVVNSPYATPAQRAAAIRMISALPGTTIARDAADAKGRVGLGISMTIAGGAMQIVFDEDDSRLLGMQVRIDDPEAFVGDSYAGSGRDRVAVIPPFDSATIAVSYEPWMVTDGAPPCSRDLCVGGAAESRQLLQRRIRAAAGNR